MRTSVAVYAVLMVLLAMALAFAPAVAAGQASLDEWVIVVVCGGAAAASLPVLALWDRWALATFVVLASFLGLAAMGFAVVLAGRWEPWHYVCTGTAATGFLAGVFYLVASQLRRDRIPNVLREHFAKTQIFENGGVQLACSWATGKEGAQLQVFMQNCVDRERTVELSFENAEIFSRGPLPIRVGELVPVRLASGEVKRMDVSVLSSSPRGTNVRIALVPHVSGPSGPRIRSWRATELTRPIPLWAIIVLMVLAAPLGFHLIVWGRGGVQLRLNLPPPGDGTPDSARTMTLWTLAA